ncbi:MAG: hypothetical protein ACTSQG_09140 [Promethearchaeota archaeon]
MNLTQNNKKITIEIIYNKENGKTNLFNFRIKKIETITERQRINFILKADNKMKNISKIDWLLEEIKEKLKEIIEK